MNYNLLSDFEKSLLHFNIEAGLPAYYLSKLICNTYLMDSISWDAEAFHNDAFAYFESKVVPHKIEVYKAGMELKSLILESELSEYQHNLIIHDLSKFSYEEVIGYYKYDFKNKSGANKDLFEKSWHHHKMNNKHHPEYWLNPNRSGVVEAIPMPAMYVVEMVADWIGAGKTYGSSLEAWLPNNLHQFVWHEHTAILVQEVLKSIGINTVKEGSNLKVQS